MAGKYELVELPDLGSGYADAVHATSASLIVGTSQQRPGGPIRAVAWRDRQIEELAFDPGVSCFAKAVNANGSIVGTVLLPNGDHRGFLCTQSDIKLTRTLGGPHSDGMSINIDDVIVGSSWKELTGPEQAFLMRGETMTSLGALRGDWSSRAILINNKGIVIGISWLGGLHTACGFIWSENIGMIRLPDFGLGCVLTSINDAGHVVGFITDPEGRQVSVTWPGKTVMETLPIPAGSIVAAINSNGDLAYNRNTDVGHRSFILIRGAGEIALPAYRGHQSEVQGLTDDLVAVGKMTAHRHSHAVLWLPSGAPPASG